MSPTAASENDATTVNDDTHSDIAGLGYEQARDELARIVQQLESGGTSLEEAMRLWERGEALANHCESWLARAEKRVEALTSSGDDADDEDFDEDDE